MSITPQAIKDQEFQVKFRGYDAIEVKAYLELVAEEFFELHETRRRQDEEFEELKEEVRKLRLEKDDLVRASGARDDESEADREASLKKDDEIGELRKKIERMEKEAAEALARKNELKEEIGLLNEKLDEEKKSAAGQHTEMEKLRSELQFKDAQIKELRQEEVDFKSTIIAAQKFSEEVRRKAEEEAAQLLEEARYEVENFRREAEQELAHLPLQIEEMRERKNKVREELRATLNSYIRMIDEMDEGGGSDVEELSDLFQSINLDEESDAPEEV